MQWKAHRSCRKILYSSFEFRRRTDTHEGDVRSVELDVAAEGVALVELSVPVPSVPVLRADGLLVSPLVALVTPEVTPTDVAPSLSTVVCPLTEVSVDVVAGSFVTPDATPVAASELWDAVTATEVRSAPVT